jgi:hypothetical protein
VTDLEPLFTVAHRLAGPPEQQIAADDADFRFAGSVFLIFITITAHLHAPSWPARQARPTPPARR